MSGSHSSQRLQAFHALEVYSQMYLPMRSGLGLYLMRGGTGLYLTFDADFVIQLALSVVELTCAWISARNLSEQGLTWKSAPLLIAASFSVWCAFAAAIELMLGANVSATPILCGVIGQSFYQWTLCMVALVCLHGQRRALEEASASPGLVRIRVGGRVFTELPASELSSARLSARRRV